MAAVIVAGRFHASTSWGFDSEASNDASMGNRQVSSRPGSVPEKGTPLPRQPLSGHGQRRRTAWNAYPPAKRHFRPSPRPPNVSGPGRLEAVKGSGNPVFDKFTDRNWEIVAALEEVADATGRSMTQVAINWGATRPGVGSVIVGATNLEQLTDNLEALAFDLRTELRATLDAVSAPTPRFPYTFFDTEMQSGLTGGTTVALQPPGYWADIEVGGGSFGVTGDETAETDAPKAPQQP